MELNNTEPKNNRKNPIIQSTESMEEKKEYEEPNTHVAEPKENPELNREPEEKDSKEEIPIYHSEEENNTPKTYNIPVSKNLEENSIKEESKESLYLPPPPKLESDTEDDDEDEEDEEEVKSSVSKTEESYTYNKHIYTVNVSESLQKDLQVLKPENKYTVHLCLYKVILDSYSPYLTYILKKKENQKLKTHSYQFPNYTFDLSVITNPLSPRTVKKMTGGSEDNDKFEAEFMEELYQQVYSYCKEPQQMPDIEPFFRGFYVKNDEIFVVIDMTTLVIIEGEYVKATPYEILISRQVLETHVHPSTTNFFKTIKDEDGNMDFYHVKKEDGNYIESPYVLYMCKANGFRGYENIKMTENTNHNPTIYTRVNHSKFGMTILFTSHAFIPNEADNLQRFLVFAEKETTLYVDADSDIDLNQLYADDAKEYRVITCIDKESQKQIWSVSTPLIINEI